MTDLTDAVHALTRPTRRKFIQDDPDGPNETKLVPIVDAPLLAQLDEAIRSSMGGTTSGGSDPRTRSVMNLAAFELANGVYGIGTKVHGWARMIGSDIDKESLSVTLERWHVKFIGNALVTNHDVHTSELRKWAGQIVATLDPPREKDLPDECPACGAGEWWRDGVRYYRPLIIRYRPADSGLVKDATASCRACAQTWGARELAFDLENASKEAIA